MSSTLLVCPTCSTAAPAGSRFCEEDGTKLPVAQSSSDGCTCGAKSVIVDGFCERCGLTPSSSQIQGPSVLGPDLAITTDVGRRKKRNEDAGAIGRGLVGGKASKILVTSDGISTASSSHLLSAGLVAVIRDTLLNVPEGVVEGAVEESIQIGHDAGCAMNLPPEPDKDPSGATIIAALAWEDQAVFGWLGDCRGYFITTEEETQLTRDDSWATQALDNGMLPEDVEKNENAHAILHCVGPLEGVDQGNIKDPIIEPHILRFQLKRPGWLLICSDGLWIYLKKGDLINAVRSLPAGATAEVLTSSLVQLALDRGGVDNITVGATWIG